MSRLLNNYIENLDPKGYVSNGEITSIDGQFLVKGSQNVLVKRSGKRGSSKGSVATRLGYKLKGAGKTMNRGIDDGYTWKMNNGIHRSTRAYYKRLEVWFDNQWITVKDDLEKTQINWTEVWNDTELFDELLFVNGTNNLYKWSGGIAKVASVTSNTITKQQFLSGTTYSFVSGTRTINDSASGFLTAGFAAGQEIVVSGSGSNDGIYLISTVTAGVITLSDDDVLTTEAAGATVTIKDTIEGTWAESHFLVFGVSNTIVIDGTTYTYTGGADSGTLTGVTPDPSAGGVANGDIAIQEVYNYTHSDVTTGWGESYELDLIATLYNHVIIGSTTSRVLYVSKNTDYTDYGFTTPLRIAGEGFEIILDAAPTAIVPDEQTLYLSAGEDFWYEVGFTLSSTQANETITVRRLKTSTGQAAHSQGAVIYIKNNIAFISFEPTLDTLGRVENIDTDQSLALSDDIKDDMELYDFTGVHGLYFRRNIYIALPREGIVLIYDVRYGFWQPPQRMSISMLQIIDGKLCGHSAHSNETYELDSAFNDNGAPFEAIAAFGYDNFGEEFVTKQCDELATVVKVSKNTKLTAQMVYDYRGATEIRDFEIDGSDTETAFNPRTSAGLGQNPLGTNPLGSLIEQNEDLTKIRIINETPLLDFFERQRVYRTNAKDARWELLGYGENTVMSDNEPAFIRK